LADVVVAHLDPIRGRAEELLSDPAELDRLLAVGADRANEQAEKTLKAVYEAVGFTAARG
jgi:tryptophanyl-tRNA synthetase